MSINGKRDDFTIEDFEAVGTVAALPRGRARRILNEVREVVADWPRHAQAVGVHEDHVERIGNGLRLDVPSR